MEPVRRFWRAITLGLRALLRGRTDSAELREELADYLARTEEALRADGLSPGEARRTARLVVGNPTEILEQVRMSRWEHVVTDLFADVRYAARMLRRSPVFTVVVVTVVALGSAAVTTILSGANAFLYRPLPGVPGGRDLVTMTRARGDGVGAMQSSYGYHRLLRARATTLSDVAAFGKLDLTISTGDSGHEAYANLVSGNFFSVLGVQPALGRFFTPDEDAVPLAAPVLVVSHEFWRTRLGGDSMLVGRTVQVNGHAFTLIGVAPPGFQGVQLPIVTSAWAPLMMTAQLRPRTTLENASATWLWQFARVQDGTSVDEVRRELARLTAEHVASGVEPEETREYASVQVAPLLGLPADAQRSLRQFLGVLLAAAALVLVIACVNVAALLSARALARQQEMAVRSALGASTTRVVRQLMTESVLLFLLGAIGGIVLTVVATGALERLPLPSMFPMVLELSPDWRVILLALSAALFTGIGFGMIPALRVARTDITVRLRNGVANVGPRRSVVARLMIVGQLALSLVLLVGSGLLLRALQRGTAVDPQFTVDGVVTARFNPVAWGYDDARARAFYAELQQRVRSVPGVTTVTTTDRLPLQMSSGGARVRFDNSANAVRDADGTTVVQTSLVNVDFFATLGIPLRSGRAITSSDDPSGARVAVVNATLADRMWPDGDAVGRTFTMRDETVTVVGVARDAKYATLTESTPLMVYLPIAQEWRTEQALLVLSDVGVPALTDAIRGAMSSIDASLPAASVQTLREATSFVLLPQRVAAMVTAALGALGLLLSSVGLYGTTSYSVRQRSREIGIRMALGAHASDVRNMVVGEALRLAGCGVAFGLLLSAAASPLIRAYLYGVSPFDPVTFVSMSVLFVLVAFVASYLPARRAAAADPLVALRLS